MPASDGSTEGITAWLKTASSTRSRHGQGFDRPHVHVLDEFREKASHHADAVDGNGECAGKRAEADSGHEDERPDKIWHHARQGDRHPCEDINGPRRSRVTCGNKCEWHCDDHSNRCAEDRNVHGFQRRPKGIRQAREIRRPGAAQDIGDSMGAGNEILRTSMDDEGRLKKERDAGEDDDERQRASSLILPVRRQPPAIILGNSAQAASLCDASRLT